MIAEILIELNELQQRNEEQREINIKFKNRMDLTIKRMVMVERRLEKIEQRLDGSEKRMEQFDKKLDQSIKELKEFSRVQNEINKYFLKEMRKK